MEWIQNHDFIRLAALSMNQHEIKCGNVQINYEVHDIFKINREEAQ